jgi:hypothetical protein
MPVANCGQTTVLTGQDGMITMKPPGTLACLKDFSDFPLPVSPATFSLISVPPSSDFRVGDPVVFTEKGTANLDGELTAGTVYYIASRPTPDKVSISATSGGTALALDGNGGSGTADTPGSANHIEMSYSSFFAMCEVPNVTMSLTRGEIDTTSIPCKPSGGLSGAKLGTFRRYQPGFVDGTGTLTLRLTPDNASFNTRIIQGTMFNDQSGTRLKAYFNAVAATGGATVSDANSLYSEFPITLLGFDATISQDEAPTEIPVNFRVSGQPSHLFGLTF